MMSTHQNSQHNNSYVSFQTSSQHGNNLLGAFRAKKMTLSNNQSMTIKMLGDKEKFTVAKAQGYIDLLLELVHCDEQAQCSRNSQYHLQSLIEKENRNSARESSGGSSNSSNLIRSDLRREWLQPETLISHCSLNQLTYLLGYKRKEVRLHIYYNTEQRVEKI